MTAEPHAFDRSGMYGRRARFYDAIYHWKPYDREAERLHDLLAAQGVADGSRVVEAACGTGSYLAHLQQWYTIGGFDISEQMINLAREKVPQAELHVQDMCDFTLEHPADALLCLFSSVGYVFPEQNLRRAAMCMADAVRPGGALIIEPWLDPADFTPGLPFMHTYDSDNLKLCRAVVGQRQGDMSVFEHHWLVAASDAQAAEHFVDRHVMWLCPRETLVQVFADAGFDCRIEEDGLMKGRGLLVGIRR